MPPSNFDSTELPPLSNRTECVLIARDPHWIYAHWDHTQEAIDRARHQINSASGEGQLILRIYDVSMIHFNGTNANHYWDLDVGFSTKNWHLHVWRDNASYLAELGIRSANHQFSPLARSNTVHTPRETMSGRFDLIWQNIQDHKQTFPYLIEETRFKSKTAKQNQLKRRRLHYLTVEDIRAYYLNLFPLLAKIRGRGRRTTFQQKFLFKKVKPLITSSEFLKKIRLGSSAEMEILEYDYRRWEGI